MFIWIAILLIPFDRERIYNALSLVKNRHFKNRHINCLFINIITVWLYIIWADKTGL